MTQPSISDKIYRPTKLAAIVDALSREGVSVDDALRDLGVKPGELHSPDTLVSLEQLLSACRIAIEALTRSDPSLSDWVIDPRLNLWHVRIRHSLRHGLPQNIRVLREVSRSRGSPGEHFLCRARRDVLLDD